MASNVDISPVLESARFVNIYFDAMEEMKQAFFVAYILQEEGGMRVMEVLWDSIMMEKVVPRSPSCSPPGSGRTSIS